MVDTYNAKNPTAGTKKFVRPKPFHELWQEKEGIPINKVFHIENMMDVELKPWERFGVNAAFVNLADPFITSSIIIELPPGGQSKVIRHMFETWCFIVSGEGETSIQQPGHRKETVKWTKRALFGPPLNTEYQHRNLSKTAPARILMVTNAPLTMNLYHNEKYIFDNDFVFEDRYAGQQGFFNPEREYLGGRITRTNFIPDALQFQLMQWTDRGAGATSFHMSMSGHTMACHLSEFEVGTYKKGHRHGPGAHVIILKGEGYSLLWREGEKPTRVNWREGSIFAPPEWWFHQHFNTGKEPARYLALRRGGSPEHPMKIGMSAEGGGPDQVEYDHEDPSIYDTYKAELDRNGVQIQMERPNFVKK